jgi:hypothetical protein
VPPYHLVDGYQYFMGASCLHLHGKTLKMEAIYSPEILILINKIIFTYLKMRIERINKILY